MKKMKYFIMGFLVPPVEMLLMEFKFHFFNFFYMHQEYFWGFRHVKIEQLWITLIIIKSSNLSTMYENYFEKFDYSYSFKC